MKTTFSGILTLLLAFVVQVSFAQTTVSGTVSDENGPLPGATVVIKGTTNGTQTDFDGNYSLQASPTDVLSFSFVGFASKDVTVGAQSTINVTLAGDNALEEVIITAQGLKKERRAIGTAITTVTSERLEAQPINDIGQILRGEVAGLNITSTSGSSGASTNIIIRGFSSITGSNQPLFIVDGAPFTGGASQDFNNVNGATDNLNQVSGFTDIDPNNIESVNVLKGLNASVLYGQAGRNGVIVITTKTGSGRGSKSGKTEISISQSTFISEAILPDYQNEFGGGFSQRFGNFVSNFGPAFNETNDSFFGSAFVSRQGSQVNITNPLSNVADQTLLAGLTDLAPSVAFAPQSSVEDFFRTGIITNTSVSARGGDSDANFSVSYSNLDDRGFTPGNTLRRNNVSVGGLAKLSNKFTIQGSANYAQTDVTSPPIAPATGGNVGTNGNSSSVFSELLFTPRHIDLFSLPFQALDGRSVYYRAGNDIQNPRWTVANARTSSESRRITGNIFLSYEFNDHWTLGNRATIDDSSIFSLNAQNRGGVSATIQTGFLNTTQARTTIFDNNLTMSGNYAIGDNSEFSIVGGATVRNTVSENQFQSSTDQIVFGVQRGFNFVNQVANQVNFEDNVIGLYADATYGFKNYLFLNGSIRNDWSSTLESDNNSLLYAGGSVSLIATDAFESIKGSVLSYLKVRGSFGESAGFPTPFQTRNVLLLNGRDFIAPNDGSVVATNSVSNILGNPGLLPERIQEIEFGVDTRFFNNKLGVNVSVFQRNTRDLITNRALDPSTGFTSTTINAGELEVQGIEVDFDLTAISTNSFSWKLNGNYSADETTILSLPDGVDQIQIAGAGGGGVANFAIPGQPIGVIQGFANQRDANGNLVINPADGTILTDGELSIIGDPNPDWTSTLINTLSYKNWSFSFEWQYRHGGDFFSTQASTLLARGNIDLGIDRASNFIIPGVLPDGSVNNIVITSSDLFFNTNLNSENRIFDGSTIRLNEASLTYTLPTKFLEKTPFGRVSLRASGNNLWFRAVNTPREANFDTNSLSIGVGNGQGIELLTGPSSRRYGVTVTASF